MAKDRRLMLLAGKPTTVALALGQIRRFRSRQRRQAYAEVLALDPDDHGGAAVRHFASMQSAANTLPNAGASEA